MSNENKMLVANLIEKYQLVSHTHPNDMDSNEAVHICFDEVIAIKDAEIANCYQEIINREAVIAQFERKEHLWVEAEKELEAAKKRELELLAVIEKQNSFLDKLSVVFAERFPRCRDCADALVTNNGICESSGLPCEWPTFGKPSQALREYEAKVLEEADKDAARDLMIKELREALNYMANESISETDTKVADEALTKSEHHNFSALVKMLLEERKREREHWVNEFSNALQGDLEHGVKWLNEKASQDFRDHYPALNHVLNELNKE